MWSFSIQYFLGSKYYENEVKKEEQVNRRLADQKQRLDALTTYQLEAGRRAVSI